MPKMRRKKRIIRGAKTNIPLVKLPPPRLYSTASERVMALPQYKNLLLQLQKGASVPNIVSWFDREGWLGTMSPSTLTQYLYKFKTECVDIIETRAKDNENYDFYVGANLPDVDALQEIDKLILVQRRRISNDLHIEMGLSKLLDSTHKEIKVMGELLSIKAGMEGKGNVTPLTGGDTATTLRNLRVDESERDRMQELTVQLIEGVRNAGPKAKKAKKVRA